MKYKFDDMVVNSTTKKKPEESDRLHYIGLEHIDSGTFEISRWGADAAPIGDKLIMKKGDVLFGKRRAYQRKVAIAPFDGIFSAHGMVLRPKEDVICKEYFPFFISSNQFMDTAVRISVGGLSPTVNWKDLQKQEFELPSIEEQRVLADKLWAAYNLKEAYKKMIVATDEMVKSQFIEMFGDINNNDDGISFDSLFFDDTKGATKISASNYRDEGTCAIYDQSQDAEICGYTNDIIGLCENYPAILFGDHSRVIKLIDTPFFIGADGVKIIRPKTNNLNVRFAYYMLKYCEIPETGYNRHFKYLKLKKFFEPDLKQQLDFIDIAQQADKSKSELRQAIDKIDKVIKSLLQ